MFEKFTAPACRVVALAQEEASALNHNYIGTEHILLGLVRLGDGIATEALEPLGVSLEAVRSRVEGIIGLGHTPASGHIPFTPRAKKVLQLALREALQLGHNYIGTEHILLGLIREGEGVGAQVLVQFGADLNQLRQRVVQLLSGYKGGAVAQAGVGLSFRPSPRREHRGGLTVRGIVGRTDPSTFPLCPGCGTSLAGALRARVLEATEDEAHHKILVVYCGACGVAVDATNAPKNG